MKKTKLLESTAHHEAGHAVAAFDLGLKIKKLSIEPDDATHGRLTHSVPFNADELEAPNSSWHEMFIRHRAEKMVVVLCAGGQAQKMCYPRGNHRSTSASDHEQAISILTKFEPHEEVLRRYFDYLDHRAKTFVEFKENWKTIEHLAGVLLDETNMSGASVVRTIVGYRASM